MTSGSRSKKVTKYHENGSYSKLPLSSFATEKLDNRDVCFDNNGPLKTAEEIADLREKTKKEVLVDADGRNARLVESGPRPTSRKYITGNKRQILKAIKEGAEVKVRKEIENVSSSSSATGKLEMPVASKKTGCWKKDENGLYFEPLGKNEAVDPIHKKEEAKTKDSNPKDAIGIKKAPLSCCSMPVFYEVGLSMLAGARKYGRHNYRAIGVRASVYFDAAMRHLSAWFECEDIDSDSGMSHITQAMSCLMVLRDAQIRGKMTDDRPPGTKGFMQALNEKAKKIIESADDSGVKHFFSDGTQDEYSN